MEILLLVVFLIALFMGFCLGRYSAAKDCNEMGCFFFKDKVYHCERVTPEYLKRILGESDKL